MPDLISLRLLTTIGIALATGAIAAMLGAPVAVWIVAGGGALAAGILAFAISPRPATEAIPPPQPAIASQPALDELIDAIDDPCLLVAGRRTVHANPPARTLLGEHVVGEDVRIAIRHPAAAERLTGDAQGEPGGRQAIELVGVGERERRWELVIHELSNQSRLVRLVDLSRTYAAEQMRVDFVANASHELRTPLSSLLGYIETLRDEGIDEATRVRFLGIMQDQAVRMQRLISDLISLSRIEGEKYRPPADAVPLAQVVSEGAEAARAAIDAGSDRIDLNDDSGGISIPGDRTQLVQMISNLVGNALKYAHGGTRVRVNIAPAANGMVRVTVTDEGEGIAPEHLPRLTERFYRVDPGRSRAMGGTGLGLAIVKHIIERHRGHLAIESEPGRGTRVAVDLPAAPDSLSSNRHQTVT